MKNSTFLIRLTMLFFGLIFTSSIYSQTVIDNENFEGGVFAGTIWNDGGSDCRIINSVPPNSNYALELTDNSGTGSSSYTNALDLSAYTSVDITFDFQTSGFTGTDDFYVEYSIDGGTNYIKIGDYNIDAIGTQFTNTTQYLAENVTLYTDATFTSTIIRFRSSATSGPNELDILYLDNIIITGYTHTFLDVSVNASSDDAEEDTSTGVMDLTSSDLEICDDTGNQYVGVRFDNITIPPGSTINRSYIQFSSDADDNTALTVTITGIDADDTTTFTTANDNISDRIDGDITSGTTATATWNPVRWYNDDILPAQQTPSLNAIVQEIIDRGGWSSSNAIGFVLTSPSTNERRSDTWDQDTTLAPKLHIEYTPPAGPEINLVGNSTTINSGDTTPTNLDDTRFTSTAIATPITHTFTIQNTGTTLLSLTGGVPLVDISGDPEFTITAQPAGATIAAAGSRTFTVQFNPTDYNTKTATISIDNDDSDENPYTFTIEGLIPTVDNFGPGGEWKYLDTGVDQGTAWRATAFDDSSWASGDAELGFGDGDETTVVTDVGQTTTYFRKSFYANATEAAFTDMILDLTYDDGAVIYLNGTEISRVNMPAGVIAYGTFASSDPGDNATTSVTVANALVTGNNVIAVEIHQRNGTSTDISFNLDISLANFIVSPGGSWKYLDDGSDQGTAWTGTGFNDTSWASGNAELGFGDGDETTTVADVNQVTTYFRKTFTVSAGDAAKSKLHLRAVIDDGAVVYINGTKVWMFNMPVTYDYLTVAEGDLGTSLETRWWTYELENILVTGSNTIAVEIHQENATSSDISFDFAMSASDDYVYTAISPDNDSDTAEDWNDGDDDNDGVPDIIEGCVTADMEDLNTTGSEDVLSSFPYTTTLSDGNVITYSVNDINDFNAGTGITSYEAGNHGWGLRVSGADTDGLLTISFSTAVDNLFMRLVDFDENEQWTINAYDDTNTLIDLTTTGVAHLGYHVEQTGNGFHDRLTGDGDNVDGDDYLYDIYGAMYLYFPDDRISRIEFSTVQNQGSTIRIVGIQYCNQDTDGDGIEDYFDSDSDNDSIPDIVEAGGVDTVGDGLVDSSIDTDNDGLLDTYDTNPSAFLVEDPSTISDSDFDGDGIPNRIDLDSDNDGILDIIEVSEPDIDGNGQIDGFTDTNDDGYHDSYDGASSRLITGADGGSGVPSSYPNKNADSNGLPNYSDVDSDDDGITDNTEAQATGSHISYTATQTDSDGVPDVYDNTTGTWGANGLVPIDTDFDCIPDYLDTNSDDDSENDSIEGHDTNGDGVVNGSDSPNADTGLFIGTDTDGDGLDDGFDNNDATFSSTNASLQATSHPIFDGLYDRDWRASNSPIDFDGVNDFVDFGDNHDFTGSFSLEAWVLQQATPASESTIMSKADAKSGNRRGYQLIINSSNQPNLTWYDASGTAVINITSPHAISNNKWYHIAATYDGSDARLYIDGLEVATASTVTAPLDGSEKFMVGAMYDSDVACVGAAKYFDGYIDEVRVWDVALSQTQLRQMMNQEISNPSGTTVRGTTIPLDIASLSWNNLEGYYPMNTGVAEDLSSNSRHGFPKYISTTQSQTAPLPYTTKANGSWNDVSGTTPWTNGDTVWNAPNAIGVDSATSIDWNIVETSHNVTIDTYSGLSREREVLGLIVASNELQVNGNTASGTGNGLTVSQYLKIDGTLDLEGESQLIQSDGSVLDATSSGTLERDQQGTADLYTYNYWAAPVGESNAITNNNSYTLPDVLNDGTTPILTPNTPPIGINWLTTGYDGASGPPIEIADYWIWKYANLLSDNYPSWQHVQSTGTLLPGEGYTMKGVTDTGGAISTEQNYVFNGKPYNGDITLPLSSGNDYLIGNPYASAIDADEFILDNISDGAGRAASNIIDGSLYFWEHFASNSHILSEYQGGYGVYNLMGSTAAILSDTRINHTGGLVSSKGAPQQFIPVAQGFFVTAEDGGTITFKNSQRIFKTEASDPSTFMRAAGSKKGNVSDSASKNGTTDTDTREKIRLMFDSPKGYHRELLVGVDNHATDALDIGYDAPLIEDNVEDMYWIFDSEKFVIQGVGDFNDSKALPLGLKIDEEGNAIIRIDELLNIPSNRIVYLHDKDLEVYNNLIESDYEIFLPAGEYLDRFEIVFSSKEEIITEENTFTNFDVHYANSINSIIIKNPNTEEIKGIEMQNILGQTIYRNTNIPTENYTEIKTNDLNIGAYIISIKTNNETIIKKVVVQ